MTVKNLVTASLIVFVLVSLGVFVANEIGRRGVSSGQEVATTAQSEQPATQGDTISTEEPAETTPDVAPAPEAASAGAGQTSEFAQETTEEMPAAATVAESGDRPKAIQVIAYYFHNTIRCKTCLKIERTAREAMEETFTEDFASGRLVWRSLNMEKPENEQFVHDYELAMPSLVLVLMEQETEIDWKRLDDTWTLIRDEDKFVSYVVEETKAYLGVH